MYGREQLETDLLYLDSQRAAGTRLLLEGKINGFQKLNLDREIDIAERECKNKLAAVRLMITDREAMIRSGKVRYWRRKGNKLMLKAHGKESPWRYTTEAELNRLRAAGYFVIELKSFPPRDGGAMPEDEADVAPPLPLVSKRGQELLEHAMEYLDEVYFAKELSHGNWVAATEIMNRLVNAYA